jgi:uncharacterized protein (TIGR02246 family)
MIRTKHLALLLVTLLATSSWTAAAETDSPQQTVTDIARAYSEGFNAADAGKVAALHTTNAEWVDSDGRVHAGRDAIRSVMSKAFAAGPGRTIALNVENVRSLGDNVLLDTGTAIVTAPDGAQTTSSYTTVYEKVDGQWLIAQITETAPSTTSTPAAQLASLGWLEGTWKGEGAQRPVTLQVSEAQNGNFLTVNYAFGEGGDQGTSTEVIGYDAAEGAIRSWTFDSEGGFSEATWQQDGMSWLLVSKSVNPDGTRASSQLELRPAADGKSFTVEGYNRESGGVPMPKLGPIKFTAAN